MTSSTALQAWAARFRRFRGGDRMSAAAMMTPRVRRWRRGLWIVTAIYVVWLLVLAMMDFGVMFSISGFIAVNLLWLTAAVGAAVTGRRQLVHLRRHGWFVCPTCNYPLYGLALKGICPECGKSYDTSQNAREQCDSAVIS